ncbi:MAG: twitching motility protein PilT [Actinomycetota bacterium]|nr:twitching motility protein PilT [Actinomycetota bacterium]
MPVTTAPVVAQVSRSDRQAQLRRFLRGCDVAPFRAEDAHDVGALAGKAAVNDVVDVHVVLVAYRRRFGVVTSDAGDLGPIADAVGAKVPLLPV